MNKAVIKMVGIGVASFVGGFLVGHIVTKIVSIPKIQAKEMERYDAEIAKTKARIFQNGKKVNTERDVSNKKPPETKETNADNDEDNVENASDVAKKVAYSHIYSKEIKKYSPPESENRQNYAALDGKRDNKPMLVDDYEELSEIMERNTSGNPFIFEWIFYYNYRGGIMVTSDTNEFVNYTKIMTYSRRELLDIFNEEQKKGNVDRYQTLYFYIPRDNIGAAIQFDGDLKPDLMEVNVPAWAYPPPSDDDEEDEDDEYEFEDDPRFDPDI